jgi:hypothetical protein
MGTDYLLTTYLAMLFFQTLYVFEEIRNGAYQEVGSLNTYLLGASSLLLLYYLPLLLIIFGTSWGVYLAFLPVLLAVGNGAAHFFRLIKDKSLRANPLLGMAIGTALTISGVLTFLGLLTNL